MAEKKKNSVKKTTSKTAKSTPKKTPVKKVEKKEEIKKEEIKKVEPKKEATKKKEVKKVENKKKENKSTSTNTKSSSKKQPVKQIEKEKEVKEVEKEEKKVDNYAPKKKEKNKKSKFVEWFNNLSLESIIIGGVIIIAVLLIILIVVSSKNTKTKNGDDIVVQVNGKVITANELYQSLKEQNGKNVAINLIDDYILNKDYKTTDDMKKSAKSTIENYKSTYGDNYQSFLEYNGIANDTELKNLLIKNSKLSMATEDYIKDNLTEKEMKKYYEDKIVGDIEAKHILISFKNSDEATDEEKEENDKKAKEKAEEIIEKLKNGEDFSKLAKEYSDDDNSKKDGGNLGYFNTGDMVAEFEEAAYKLAINEYTTEPVKTTYGYHIIMKTGEKEKPSYKKSKDTIIKKLVEEKKNEDSNISVKAMIALRKKYNLKIKDKTIKSEYNTYIKDATTTTTTTTASE